MVFLAVILALLSVEYKNGSFGDKRPLTALYSAGQESKHALSSSPPPPPPPLFPLSPHTCSMFHATINWTNPRTIPHPLSLPRLAFSSSYHRRRDEISKQLKK